MAIPLVRSHVPSLHRGRLLLTLCCLLSLLSAIAVRAQAPAARILWTQTHFTGAIAYSPTQSLIAATQGFSELALLHPDGTLVRTIRSGQGVLTSLAFAPDGMTLASGSWGGTIKLWRVSDGACLQTITGQTGTGSAVAVLSVAFAQGGQTLASGGYDGTIKLWNVNPSAVNYGACLQTLTGHRGSVNSVAFAPDGLTLASGGTDTTVRLWRVSDGAPLRTIVDAGSVYSVAFAPDGQTLASGCGYPNYTSKLWRVSDGVCLHTFTGFRDSVSSVAFTPNGQTLAAGSGDGTIKLWNVNPSDVNYGACLWTLTGTDGVLAIAPDGLTLVACNPFGSIILWRVSDGAYLQTINGHSYYVTSVAFAPDGQTLASGSNNGTITFWRVSDGAYLRTITGTDGSVNCMTFAPDGQTLATGDYYGTIKLWRVSDGTCQQTFPGVTTNNVWSVAFSPDGQTLAASYYDHTIKLWRVSDGACLQTLSGHTNTVSSVAFAPDGQTLASASWDKTIKLWEVNSSAVNYGACLKTFTGHNNVVTSVAFAPDGQTLASGSWDQTIKLWEVNPSAANCGACLQTLSGHTYYVTSVAFAPDGQTLASGSRDQTIKLWDVNPSDVDYGTCLQTLTGYTNDVNSVAFAPDGQTLASGGVDGVALWSLSWPLTMVTLTPSPASAQPVNTPITLSGAATGGADVVYQFLVNGTVIRDYTASSSCTWRPAHDGSYQLTVNARDLDGADPTQFYSSPVVNYSVLPVAVADAYTVTGGATLTVTAANGLLANDLGSPTLTIAAHTNPAHGTLLSVAANGTFSYQPAAGFYGTDTFTYTVGDGALTSAPATVILTVASLPLATADAYTINAGSTLTVTAPGVLANDTNADGNPLSARLSTGVSNGSLKLNADGSFSYTPKAGFSGTDSFTYRAVNGTLVSNAATVTITVNSIPVATTDAYTAIAGSTLTVAASGVLANDTNADGGPLSARLSTGTANGTLKLNADGSFSYTPKAGFLGTDAFTYRASKGTAVSNAGTVTISVYSLPVATADAYTVNAGSTLTIAAPGVLANDTNADKGALSAILGADPANGKLTLNADGSFSYTPKAGFSGTDSFTYTAADAHETSLPTTVTISVYAIPLMTNDAYTINAGVPLTVAAPGVLANDSNADGRALTAVLRTGPANVAAWKFNADGSFSYTSKAGFSGTTTFTYRAINGTATPTGFATVTITVTPIPVATADTYTVTAGNTLTLAQPGVLSNDINGAGGTLTATLGAGPANGTLTLNTDGSFSYTPNAGFFGKDTFTYTASNGGYVSNPATVTLSVYSLPTATADAYTVNAGATLTLAKPGVLANDTNADGGTLSTVLNTGPVNGKLTFNADGSFSYTPKAGFSGTDSFTYTAKNGTVVSAPATVTLTVYSIPLATADAYTVNTGSTLSIAAPGVLSNDTNADGRTLTAVLRTGTANGALKLNADGSFSYTPKAGFSGTDAFTYRATNGTATSGYATVTLTVVSAPIITRDDAYAVSAGSTLTITAASGVLANDTNTSGSPITAVLRTGVANGTLKLNADGSFSYIPKAGFTGTDSFTYKATNGTAMSSYATVTITVNGAHSPVG